jgi:hypothetical protein
MQTSQGLTGVQVHDYLCQYAREFDLVSRIRLQTKIESAELRNDGQWLLAVRGTDQPSQHTTIINAKRLVLATGLTSEPHVPELKGKETFTGNLLHSRQLRDRAEDIRASKEVVVIGANKSAWDTCYSAATAGAHVNMVIRPGGGGPSWVWPVALPFKLSLQKMATTRFFTLFDPWPWNGSGVLSWVRTLLHRTRLGRQLVKLFWSILTISLFSANGYRSHSELRKLTPWSSMFWMGNSLGVHNYETNWFELVKQGRISVQIAEVTSLSGSKVSLSNGQVILADTVVCCTGWKMVPTIKFLPDGVGGSLDLPGACSSEMDMLFRGMYEKVFRLAPALLTGPKRSLPPDSAPIVSERLRERSLPYRLHRFMVPCQEQFLDHRNIAFIGAHLALNAITVAQAQALWIVAFFENQVGHLDSSTINHKQVREETMLQAMYCRHRHPPEGGGAGERCPDLIFDGLLYTDSLMRDIGLRSFRKRGIWQELFRRYTPGDYATISDEYLARRDKTR